MDMKAWIRLTWGGSVIPLELPYEWFMLSQIRGRVVVLRDRIHRELENLRNLIWFVKVDSFRDLNVNCSFILNKCLFSRLIEVLVLKKKIVRLRVFIQETLDYSSTNA